MHHYRPASSPSFLAKAYHRAFSLGALRPHVKEILPFLRKGRGKFIEVGAGSGGPESFTLYLEKALGWSGILIEPWPHLYRRCRSKRTRSASRNVAVADLALADSYIEVRGLPPKASVRRSLREAKATLAKPTQIVLPPSSDGPERVSYINTDTLSHIIEKTKFPNEPDFLAMNLVGMEDIALQGLDFDRHSPHLILIRMLQSRLSLPNLPAHYRPVRVTQFDNRTVLRLFKAAPPGEN